MIIKKEAIASGYRLVVRDDVDGEVGHAYLYVLHNDLNERPFAFMEDVFIDDSCRGQGYGKELVAELINLAKSLDCYKLVGTSRYSRESVHQFYDKLGFKDWGKEFRLDF